MIVYDYLIGGEVILRSRFINESDLCRYVAYLNEQHSGDDALSYKLAYLIGDTVGLPPGDAYYVTQTFDRVASIDPDSAGRVYLIEAGPSSFTLYCREVRFDSGLSSRWGIDRIRRWVKGGRKVSLPSETEPQYRIMTPVTSDVLTRAGHTPGNLGYGEIGVLRGDGNKPILIQRVRNKKPTAKSDKTLNRNRITKTKAR